jgi:diguanylate cyclase (GGDEF)-like protein
VIVTGDDEREVRYQAFDAGANDFVSKPVDHRELAARLTTLLALREAQQCLGMKVGSLEASLLDAEERAHEHAERLEGLWRIANNPRLADDELISAMLEQAAAAIRPGQAFIGLLGRIEGSEVVTDAIAGDFTHVKPEGVIRVGMRIALEHTFVAKAVREGETRSWDDLRGYGEVPAYARALEWRAAITTQFTAGGVAYALTFASLRPAMKPFDRNDHAYAEIVGQFFSTHLQQRWQLDRIRQQLDHDALTGLLNRSRFRSLGRAALRAGAAAAVAVFDVRDFHEINESHGHSTGDAVLVELAAALEARADANEIVARVGGDSYAVFFPTLPSQVWALERVARLGAVFDEPKSTGDREGQEFVRVTGVVGVAFAPEDGSTLDDLLFRAEARAVPR